MASKVQEEEAKVPSHVPCKVGAPARFAFEVGDLPIVAGIWEQMKALCAERK